MTGRPRLLDLFCGAGGAGAGYMRAGFDVLGVDIRRQPHCPHPVIVADVMALPIDFLRMFDAIHASPPCQGYSALRHAPGAKGTAPRLIGPVRAMVKAAGVPWVIENVEQARKHMIAPTLLCGSMFVLSAEGYHLRRHRLFEASFPIVQYPCVHADPVIGVYGGHVRCRSAKHGGRKTRDFEGFDKPALAKAAMGIDWMTMAELSEAIPPAYTQLIGAQLHRVLRQREVA